MGTRQSAYLKYLRGDNSDLTERGIDINDLSQFQHIGEIASKNKGQMLYDMYPQGEVEARQTIGRTAPGQITRDGNTWVIKDDYNFNGANTSLWDKAKYIAKSFLQGDPLAALSRASTLIGSEYKTDIRVPMSPEQIARNGGQMAYNPDNTIVGGQQYGWKPQVLNDGENYETVAQKAFANNQYKPEGKNLDNYTEMIRKQNAGNHSNIVYVPVRKY